MSRRFAASKSPNTPGRPIRQARPRSLRSPTTNKAVPWRSRRGQQYQTYEVQCSNLRRVWDLTGKAIRRSTFRAMIRDKGYRLEDCYLKKAAGGDEVMSTTTTTTTTTTTPRTLTTAGDQFLGESFGVGGGAVDLILGKCKEVETFPRKCQSPSAAPYVMKPACLGDLEIGTDFDPIMDRPALPAKPALRDKCS